MRLARKRIVFVIVEGPSDDEALGLFFHQFYKDNSVYVHIVHGDLTVTNRNIKNEIADAVKKYADSNHFQKIHFKEVIHLVDMDGAYISDDAIVKDNSAEKTVYTLTEIRTASPDLIRERNAIKRKNLDTISQLSKVWGTIPYRAYYMSCNLEHVLYNTNNCSDDEKERFSIEFARRYRNNFNGFIELLKNSEFSVSGEYKITWAYIKERNRSLQRNSNLWLCFDDTQQSEIREEQ